MAKDNGKTPVPAENAAANPLAQTIVNKYVLINMISAVLSVICFMTGSTHEATAGAAVESFCQSIAAALILLAATAVLNITLYKRGLDSKTLLSNIKSIDPKVNGDVTDASAVCSIAAAVAAVSTAFSEMFIVNGGELFASNHFYVYLMCTASKCITLYCVLAGLASPEMLFPVMAVQCANISGEKGPKVMKICQRITHNERALCQFRRTITVHITTSLALSVLCVITAFTSVSLIYKTMGLAVLYALHVILSIAAVKKSEDAKTEDKLSLMSKKTTSFIVLNTVMFLFISVMVLYSFPFRSVYTDYQMKHDFAYNYEYSEKIDIFTIPPQGTEGLRLYSAMFVITALFILVQFFTAYVYDNHTFGERFQGDTANAVMAVFISGIYYIFHTMLYSGSGLDALMWLVCISLGCLMLGAELIRIMLMSHRQTKTEKTNK